MTTQHLQNVENQLALLHGHAYFRITDGPLKESLTQHILDAVEGDLAEQLAGGAFDLEVNIGRQEGEAEIAVGYRVDRPGVVYRSELPLSRLDAPALQDLEGYLSTLLEKSPAEQPAQPAANVVRKKQDHDHHEKEAAAARLKVTPQWLKSVVPCTEYSYDEIDGKKYIREYYWSRDLIERLFRIKSTKTTPEDLQYVAKECCDGDMEWARDLIARLKSPNRPEPAPKEQPQKAQKGQGQHGQRQQGQGQQAQGQQAQQGQGQQGQGQAQQQSKPGMPGESRRSRSRHRKPFRQQGKDPRRPDQPGPKPPQGQ